MKRIGTTTEGHTMLAITGLDMVKLSAVLDVLKGLFEPPPLEFVNLDKLGSTFEATGTRQPDGSIKAKTIKPVATKTRKTDEGKKACSVCGKMFVPPRSDSTCCSASCRGKAYRAAKAGGVKPVSVTKCLGCGRPFEPKRKDQTCCSKACRKAMPSSNRVKVRKAKKDAAVKTMAPTPVAVVARPTAAVTSKADRLALLKRLANKGVSVPKFIERAGVSPNLEDIPEYQRARSMASEGRDS